MAGTGVQSGLLPHRGRRGAVVIMVTRVVIAAARRLGGDYWLGSTSAGVRRGADAGSGAGAMNRSRMVMNSR